MTLIQNAMIHDGIHETPYQADVLIEDGRIRAVGRDLGRDGIDASGLNLYPGMVDAHSHLGLSGWGIGFEGIDYNEMGDVCTPQMRAVDSFNPQDPAIAMARKAGVTTVGTGQGSANAIGGTWIAVKTYGSCVDDMIVKDPVAMKCALGENPKRCYQDKGNCARMSTASVIRRMIHETKDYMARQKAADGDPLKMPAYNDKCEAMIPVLKKEIPLKIHAHQANDILTAIRIAKEFDLKLTIEHVTEGHLIVDQLAKHKDIPLAVGPALTDASKFELRNLSWTTPGVLAKAGCRVSIVTDHPFSCENYLPLEAYMAVQAGMDEFDALQAITIRPAEHLGIADRVGSIETGKDADFILTEGNLIGEHVIHSVWIDGEQK